MLTAKIFIVLLLSVIWLSEFVFVRTKLLSSIFNHLKKHHKNYWKQYGSPSFDGISFSYKNNARANELIWNTGIFGDVNELKLPKDKKLASLVKKRKINFIIHTIILLMILLASKLLGII